MTKNENVYSIQKKKQQQKPEFNRFPFCTYIKLPHIRIVLGRFQTKSYDVLSEVFISKNENILKANIK